MSSTEHATRPATFDAEMARAVAGLLEEPLTKGLADAVLDRLTTVLDRPTGLEPLLTVGQVADRLAVSKRTVETMIAEGELKPVRVRGARRFERGVIDAYVRDRTT